MSGRQLSFQPHNADEDGDQLDLIEEAGTEPTSFTCPRCGRTSWNPNDVREGYCGACHDWTRPR